MKNLLILNQNPEILAHFLPLIEINPNIGYQIYDGDLKSAQAYEPYVKNANWILSLLGPNDVDWYLEELFAAIYQTHTQIDHFVMLSYAGIDDELVDTRKYKGVADQKEFLKQQRYAIKIVDEAEFPYTIIRASEFGLRSTGNLHIFPEGQVMPNGLVSHETTAKLIADIFENDRYRYTSIGIVEE